MDEIKVSEMVKGKQVVHSNYFVKCFGFLLIHYFVGNIVDRAVLVDGLQAQTVFILASFQMCSW